MDQPSVQKLKALCSKLDELSGLSYGLLNAIDAGNEAAVLECVYEGRQARAALARTKRELDAVTMTNTASELELMARVTELMGVIRVGDQATDQWLSRKLPDDEVMLRTEVGQIFLADAMLPAVWEYEHDIVVLVGRGLGPLAAQLIAFEQKRLFVYIPDEDPIDYPSEVVHIARLDEIEPYILNMGNPPPQRIATRQLPSCNLGSEVQSDIAQRVHNALADLRVHKNTVVNFARTWVSQGIENLLPIASSPSIDTIGDAYAGMPIVIVAPGPSLKKNIEQLKAVKGKALIMCFSHSVTPLSQEGIDPDFVVSVDPQDVRYHFSKTDMTRVTAVVNGATVHPDLFRLDAPQAITLAANSDLEQWIFGAFGENARASGGGSVATTALSVALKWKCNPIVFCGLDLSFPDGKMYIDTSLDGDTTVVADSDGNVKTVGWSEHCEDMQRRCNPLGTRVQRGIELPGYYGGTVASDFSFSMFHRWFEHTARGKSDDIRMINCTEGGAYIDGMEHAPLAETLAEFQGSVDAAAILDSVIEDMKVDQRRGAMQSWLLDLLKGVNTTLSLAHRCKRLTKQADTSEGHEKLQRFERDLMAAVGPLQFVSMLAQLEIEYALEKARDAENVADAIESSERIFDTIIDIATWIRPQLKDAINAIATAT